MVESHSPQTYCGTEVRVNDPERYLISLFAADEDRGALHALYAFNLELAKVATIVSEPLLGQVRLQWWRESIAGIYDGSPRHHEVVLALAEAVKDRDLPRDMFETMITGREVELEAGPPETVADLEAYLRSTAGELVALGLRAVGAGEGDDLIDAGRSVGIASGYMTILRALRSQRGRQRPLVPAEVLARHGVAPEDVAQGRVAAGLSKAVEELAHQARTHLAEARRKAGRPKRRHMAPLLTGALLPSYLGSLKSAGYDLGTANFERGSLGRTLRVYRNALLRKV